MVHPVRVAVQVAVGHDRGGGRRMARLKRRRRHPGTGEEAKLRRKEGSDYKGVCGDRVVAKGKVYKSNNLKKHGWCWQLWGAGRYLPGLDVAKCDCESKTEAISQMRREVEDLSCSRIKSVADVSKGKRRK